MTQCELCGIEDMLVRAKIEGTILNVCTKCAGFGEILQKPKPSANSVKTTIIHERKKELFVIVPEYSQLIRNAREKNGLTQEELAVRLHEKASLIQKLETGEMTPSVILAKKIQEFLHIALLVPYNEELEKTKKTQETGLTIGDILLSRTKGQ